VERRSARAATGNYPGASAVDVLVMSSEKQPPRGFLLLSLLDFIGMVVHVGAAAAVVHVFRKVTK
jgi:hypothetical protein